MIYDVEEHHQPHHAVKLILMRNVDDFGVKGQVVTVLFHQAHPKLLLPGFAVYHTEENLERLGDFVIPEDQLVDSSPSAKQFVNFFSKWTFDIVMSSSTPWRIEAWHVAASLRKHGVWLGEEHIEIPGGAISGPDMGLQNKEFIAVVTVNSHEKVGGGLTVSRRYTFPPAVEGAMSDPPLDGRHGGAAQGPPGQGLVPQVLEASITVCAPHAPWHSATLVHSGTSGRRSLCGRRRGSSCWT